MYMNDTSTTNQSQEKKEVILWEELKNTTQPKKLESPITPNECATTINIKDLSGNEHLIDIIGELGKHHRHKTGIYLIHCSGNDKIYIGSAVNLYKRMLEHKRMLRMNKHHSAYAQNSYDKYGIDTFRFYVIRECLRVERKDIEDVYIKKYFGFKVMLNMINGARGTDGMKFTPERIAKIVAANLGRIPHNKGCKMEDDQKRLLSQIHLHKTGKLIDVYSIDGRFIETVLGINSICRNYVVDKKTAQRVLNGVNSHNKNHVFRYHREPFNNNNKQLKVINDNNKLKCEIYKLLALGIGRNECARRVKCSTNMVSLCIMNYISFIYAKIELSRKSDSVKPNTYIESNTI